MRQFFDVITLKDYDKRTLSNLKTSYVFSLVIIATLLFMQFGCAGNLKWKEASGTFVSQDSGFSITFPEGWFVRSVGDHFVEAMDPSRVSSEGWMFKNIMITTRDLNEYEKLEDFQVYPSNSKIIDKGESEINGYKTIWYVYSNIITEGPLSNLNYALKYYNTYRVIHGSELIRVQYATTTQSIFHEDLGQFDRMVSTLTLQ